MTDYSTLADRDINRLVAERLGWHDFEMSSYWLDDYFDTTEVHCEFGTSPSGDYRPLPSWATSIDAAAALDFGDGVLEVTLRPGKDVIAKVWVDGYKVAALVGAATMARAITECWLCYRDAPEAK